MKIGFIDYYLDEWHANTYPARLKELSNGEMEVAYAFAEIDSPLPDGMTTDEWCRKNDIQRVDSIEKLVELSDGIVVLSPDNCERHEQLCRIPLASGKRCYVDKAFAPDGETANMVRLAIPAPHCAMPQNMPGLIKRRFSRSALGGLRMAAAMVMRFMPFISWSRS